MSDGRITPIQLLAYAHAAAENHPERDSWSLSEPMYPENAWTLASALLAAVTAVRTVEWLDPHVVPR